jgi:hypothetical protein
MNDRGWLWTIALVVIALFVHDWLRREGVGDAPGSGWVRSSRWNNLRVPAAGASIVSPGLAPNASGGVPLVDAAAGGKGCGCS